MSTEDDNNQTPLLDSSKKPIFQHKHTFIDHIAPSDDPHKFFTSSQAEITVFFMITSHLLIGAIIFYFLNMPNWTFLESLYFAVVTVTTVGYGDFSPNRNDTMKFLASIYIWLSLAVVSMAVGLLSAKSAFNSMRESRTKYTSFRTSILGPIFYIFLFVILGTMLFPALAKNWTYVDGFYYSTVTLSSVGYGDYVAPQDFLGFAIFYILLGVVMVSKLVGSVASYFVDEMQQAMRETYYSQCLTESRIKAMDVKGTGEISEIDFLCFMLTETGLVVRSEITAIRDRFHEMDVDGSNTLTLDDIRLMSHKMGV